MLKMALRGLLLPIVALIGSTALSSCAAGVGGGQAVVHLIALNDFHGALAPPQQYVTAPAPDGKTVRVPAGGAAYLASAVDSLRAAHPDAVVVAAGDLIGASPLASGAFLDEPSIEALNMMHLEFTAVGNHEFDRGPSELLRMAHGGCQKLTAHTPCALDAKFPGARFSYLAANVLTDQGEPLFTPYVIKTIGKGRRRVKVAFIGLTLKSAPEIVTPGGVDGLRFLDEADTANALAPKLRKAGAAAVVVLIHQGGSTKVGYNDKSCAGLDGDILPILDRLDPSIDLVISGHTHRAYICDYGRINSAHPLLLTSASNNGVMVTDITLKIDLATHRVVAKDADNIIVQSESYAGSAGAVPLTDLYPRFAPSPPVAALVAGALTAVAAVSAQPTGILAAPATRRKNSAQESVLGDLIADAQLAAMQPPDKGGAQFALMNDGGLRADLIPSPGGQITYGQIFAAQPFANAVMVKTMTGRQILAVLEQQFEGETHSVTQPNVLLPSSNLHFAYDLSRPAGTRIVEVQLDRKPLEPDARYQVAANSFLGGGSDGFPAFGGGTDPVIGPDDATALDAYLTTAGRLTPPTADRIRNLTPN
jgi:5'-nucleotidase